jgi:hypothetical protein
MTILYEMQVRADVVKRGYDDAVAFEYIRWCRRVYGMR